MTITILHHSRVDFGALIDVIQFEQLAKAFLWSPLFQSIFVPAMSCHARDQTRSATAASIDAPKT